MSFPKYVKTAPAGSQEELSYITAQALVVQFNALLAKIDADNVAQNAVVTNSALSVNYGELAVVDPNTLLIQSPKVQGT